MNTDPQQRWAGSIGHSRRCLVRGRLTSWAGPGRVGAHFGTPPRRCGAAATPLRPKCPAHAASHAADSQRLGSQRLSVQPQCRGGAYHRSFSKLKRKRLDFAQGTVPNAARTQTQSHSQAHAVSLYPAHVVFSCNCRVNSQPPPPLEFSSFPPRSTVCFSGWGLQLSAKRKKN